MRTGPIDLHTHSSVSDGTETPAELVAAAAEQGLGAVALTDHDSTAGWAAAAAAVQGTGMMLVPGMELSTRIGWSSVHMLGYLFDPASPSLVRETTRLRDDRMHRAERMVAKIGADYDLSWQDVLDQASEGATLGRPHIADALVAKGYARDRSAAFAGILHWRSGYYEPHEAPSPLVGVRLIREAGGVPVLAHPATHGRDTNVPRDHLIELVEAGLGGVEVGHRENTAAGRERLLELAKKYDLVVTGSSDYHGDGKPNRLAENSTDPAQFARIVEQATGSAPIQG
ncbi:metal-dependent phosphoesterase [Frondihabitans sp. PAMC 28766]|uniref:PHP domain-containing protein n=1 Tax=Frondihabitans sp. PAMC 28766 TaxID=1795630 RepID=UPI00078BA9C0|nr:PHP domain-containing protein [Frondihabitans sp. PAMC 28766]AMM20299.1 metal-dependent phosphoesterase [Frondihabitans sp. PAMC 28766]